MGSVRACKRSELEAVLLAAALLLAGGCGGSSDAGSGSEPDPETAREAAAEPAERERLRRVAADAFEAPGMECLVNEHGIRVKVLIRRRNVRGFATAGGTRAAGPELRYFHHYYVFEVDESDPDRTWYRIGPTPRRESILGWVSSKEALRWDHRVGLRLIDEGADAPRRPLLVYAERDSVVELLRTGSTDAEPIARALPRRGRAHMPWPVVEHERVRVDGHIHEIARIAFLGEAAPPGTPPARKRLTRGGGRQVHDEAIRSGVAKLDVVFCIDLTGSMQPHIDATRDTVRRLTRRLTASFPEASVAFGLVGFRDYAPGSEFVTRSLPLTEDHDGFLSDLARLECHGGGDIPEAVYDGVQAALETDWRDRLSTRVVVLIGDAPPHEPGHPKNPHDISREQLIEEANEQDVQLFSLAVGNDSRYRARLHEAFGDLAHGTGGTFHEIGDDGELFRDIEAVLTERTRRVQRHVQVVDDLVAGYEPDQIADRRELELYELTEVMQFLDERGVEFDGDDRRNRPEFETGWVACDQEHERLVTREVLISRSEVDLLLSALNLLSATLSADLGTRALEVGIVSRSNPVAQFFLDDLPEPLDIYLMARGVPTGSTSVLRLDRSELRHMSERRRADLRERIGRELVPPLVHARNDQDLWLRRQDLDMGWINEEMLP